jgi:hypothetical protein
LDSAGSELRELSAVLTKRAGRRAIRVGRAFKLAALAYRCYQPRHSAKCAETGEWPINQINQINQIS